MLKPLTDPCPLLLVLLAFWGSVFPADAPGTGLSAHYYPNTTLDGPASLQRIDAAVDFSWGGAAPATVVPANLFSVRWIGFLTVPTTGRWDVTTVSDDGILVRIGSQVLISDWTNHSVREATASIELVAGRKYPIEVNYYENGGVAVARLLWSGPGVAKSVIPQANLYPLNGPAITIPTASSVSPAFIEGTAIGGAVVKGNGATIASPALSNTVFYADVPLTSTGATTVQVTAMGRSVTGTTMWTATPLSGDSRNTIRVNDSLLFKADTAGSWMILRGSGVVKPSQSVVAGQLLPYTFVSPGAYRVVAKDAAQQEIGVIDVTVVGVAFPTPIACEVGFIRSITASVAPVAEDVTFVSSDVTTLKVTPMSAVGTTAVFGAQPLRRGDPRVVARLLGATGPIVAVRSIDEFTIDVSGAQHLMMHADEHIGRSRIVIRPYIPDLNVTLAMFAHGGTFAGGAKRIDITTTADFLRGADTTAGFSETVGAYFYDIEMPPGEHLFCHDVAVRQVTAAAVAGGGSVAAAVPDGGKGDPASKPRQINGHACTCEMTVPCACTEEIVLLKVKLTGTGNKPWNIVLVSCPDPGTAADGKPVFDIKGGGRRKGPVPCDGQERVFPIYTGTVRGPHKIYVERDGTCFECGEICVFPRMEFAFTLNRGFGCGGALPVSPYTGFPQAGAGINIPGGTGGSLLWKQTDDCGNTASLWCTGQFKFMFEGVHGSGKIGECSFVPGLNEWVIGFSKCGDLRHFTRLEMLNFNGTPSSSGSYEYRYYSYDVCGNKLAVNKNSTATLPANYPPEQAEVATGGTDYSGTPFGVDSPVQP